MNYELATELKDARFPQPAFVVGDPRWGFWSGSPGEWYFCPTLEELIEACGEGFWTLVNSKMLKGTVWLASQYVLGDEIKAQGATPIEAVARLWLALNRKENGS